MFTIQKVTRDCDGVPVISPQDGYPPDAIAVVPSPTGYDVYMPGDEELLAARLLESTQ